MIRWLAVFSLLVLLSPARVRAGDSPTSQAAFAEEPSALTEEPSARAQEPSALAQEWSLRLMQEQARIDHTRKRLDEANAAYVRAVAKAEDELVIASFASRRRAAAAELEDAEKKLPRLVAEAREEGVGEEILKPYRFAVSPADVP